IQIHTGELINVFDTKKNKKTTVYLTTIENNQKEANIEVYVDGKKYQTVTFTDLPEAKAGKIGLPLTFRFKDKQKFIIHQATNTQTVHQHEVDLTKTPAKVDRPIQTDYIPSKTKLSNEKKQQKLYFFLIPVLLTLLLLIFIFSQLELTNKTTTTQKENTEQSKNREENSTIEQPKLTDKEKSPEIIKQEFQNQLNQFFPFEFIKNTYTLAEGETVKISAVAQLIKKYQKAELQLHGYTADTNEDAGERWLSEQRAQFIKTQLEKYLDTNQYLITIKGHGSNNPIFSNPQSEEDAQRNRRVEIIVLKCLP
ncbi:MAG: OmpA family protein, partial [Spirochaetes bacterium]|nr:OmpA family protein [Spirochaetota bacterium]